MAEITKMDRVLRLVDTMTPEERKTFFDEIDVILKTAVDRALSIVERMTDEERIEFFDVYEAMFCCDCGQPHGEQGHECSLSEDDEGDDESVEEIEDSDDAP